MTLKINHLIHLSRKRAGLLSIMLMGACLLLMLLSFNSNAIEVTDLYRSQVPIDSQSTDERGKKLVKAMEAVLIKVGGHRQVLAHSEFKKALRQVSSYVSQYQYLRRQNQLFLQADFDEQKIKNLFQTAQLPIWGSHRPLIILWVIEEQGVNREVYHDDEQSVKTVQIKDHAQLRGLPLILPLMDLEDNLAVSNAEIWGRFPESVLNASRRYLAEASIVMRISDNTLKPTLTVSNAANDEDSEEAVDSLFTSPYRDYINPENNQVIDCQPLCIDHSYVLDWTLVSRDRHVEKSYSGNVKGLLITQALNDITEIVYQYYAFNVEPDDSELLVDVANVKSMPIYLQLTEFFSSLSSVERVHLQSVEGDRMRFKLSLLGNRQSVLKALSIDSRLVDITDPLAPVTEVSVPVFQWNHR